MSSSEAPPPPSTAAKVDDVLPQDDGNDTPMGGQSSGQVEQQQQPPPGEPQPPAASEPKPDGEAPMSKNALKRLRRQQKWDAGKDDRRQRRKEKRHDLKKKRAEHRDALLAQGIDPKANQPVRPPSQTVPVSLVLDCDFEQYMTDKERISLASQLTRSYSDNRQALYRVHLWVSGWKGRLVDRFENVLDNQHKNWKVKFVEGDFVECAEQSQSRLADPELAGVMIPSLQHSLDAPEEWTRDARDPIPLPDTGAEEDAPLLLPETRDEHRDIVYLTADSPYTLSRLNPGTTYIIGGLVDKNREKGLCYRLARQRGIRTARLPIGKFLAMQSRQVLATNHVVEIMLKWLEFEDWGKAFMAVIPKRKGGKLIEGSAAGDEGSAGQAVEEGAEGEEVREDSDGIALEKDELVEPKAEEAE